jgi:hypothetical protein
MAVNQEQKPCSVDMHNDNQTFEKNAVENSRFSTFSIHGDLKIK